MVFGLFKKKEPVKVTVKGSGETFMCEPNELLMKAALRQNIAWPCSCKVGSCGSCRSKIVILLVTGNFSRKVDGYDFSSFT